MIRRRAGPPNGCRAWPEAQSKRQSRASGCRTTSPRTLRHRTSTPGSRARAQAAPRYKGPDDRHVPVGHRRGRVDRGAGAKGTLLQQIAIGMLYNVQCGRKLHVSYIGKLGRYSCYGARTNHGTARCITISGLTRISHTGWRA